MKIRNSSRITAIVLALVMLLPLISIPTFAAPTAEQTLFSEDFSSYADLDADGILAKVNKSWYQSARNMQVVNEEGNTYLRFPTEALINSNTRWNGMAYAIYKSDYAYWDSTEPYKNYVATAFDLETKKLTLTATTEGVDPLVLDVDTTNYQTDGGEGIYYGTFVYNEFTWSLTSPYWAACAKSGDGNAIDRYAHIYFGDRTFYTADDPEVLAGTKNVGDKKSEPAGISYVDHDKVVVVYKGMIEEGSAGTHNMQLNVFKGDATINNVTSQYSQNFVELGNLNLATGAWSGGALGGATLPIGEWVELTFIVDLVNGTVQGVFDGQAYGTVSVARDCNGDKVADKMTNLVLSGWSVSKIMKSDPTKLTGAWCVDDVAVYTGDYAKGLIKFNDYVNDFETGTVGGAVPGLNSVNSAYKVAEVDGSKVWALGNSNDGTGARDQNATIKNEAFVSDMDNKLTFSMDYYIPTGAQGQFQTQLYPNKSTAIMNGSVGNLGWSDLFVVRSEAGAAYVGRESSPKMYPVPYDEWFTIALEFDMAGGYYDIYLNGNLVIPGQSHANVTSYTSIGAAGIIVGKQNKAADSFLSGTWYADNISLKAGAYADANMPETWHEDELLSNFFAVDLTNDEIAGAVLKAPYSGPSGLVPVDFDEDYIVDALKLNIFSDAVADDPATEENETVAESNVDLMVRPLHPGYSKAVYETIILSANYIVSEDAQGKIQSELHDSNVWTSLFIIDADECTINGVAFEKGVEFNVTTVIDTATGIINVYYNNLLIDSNKVANNGLSSAEWSVAKVMKYCEAYAGNIIIDEMTITTTLADDKSANDLYLYDEEGMVEVSADMMETVKAASIRLFAPTGLRFATKLNADFLAVAGSNFQIGTLIAPADYVEEAGAFTPEALSELMYLTTYIDVQAEVGNYYNGNGTTGDLAEGAYMTASIVNILEGNIDRDFAAIGYIKYKVNNEWKTVYAADYHTANVQDIAAAALESGNYDAYESILSAYAAGLQPAY